MVAIMNYQNFRLARAGRPCHDLPAVMTILVLLALLSGCAGAVGQGNLALARGDYQAAEDLFLKALEDDSENLTARRRLAMTYFYMGRDTDPARFGQAVEQFAFIQERRTMQPEEQFYYGLCLVGQGQRDQGFAVLKTLSHPTKFRIQQRVRQRAARLEPYLELPMRDLASEMEKAWREGDAEDKQEELEERRDDPYRRWSPVPLR